MPSKKRPTVVDPAAAARWERMAVAQSPWLHEEVARRMAERLDWIRLPVERWIDWEPLRGGINARELVGSRYPQAQRFDVVKLPAEAVAPRRSWWQRKPWRSAPATAHGPVAPEGEAQLVWSNMLLHHSAEPEALIVAWHKALAVNGFLMFSCFGPDTLRELRTLYAEQGWSPPVSDFVDMHDWGDLLIASGFADPVVFMEHITLTFPSAARALRELRGLGTNTHPERFGGLRTPGWRRRLEALMERGLRAGPAEPITLTFEVIYGHAVRPKPRLVRSALAPRIAFNSD